MEKEIQTLAVEEGQEFEQDNFEGYSRIGRLEDRPEEKWYQSTTSESEDELEKHGTETANRAFYSKS